MPAQGGRHKANIYISQYIIIVHNICPEEKLSVRRNSVREAGFTCGQQVKAPIADLHSMLTRWGREVVAAEGSLERSKGRRPEVWNCMRHIPEALFPEGIGKQ